MSNVSFILGSPQISTTKLPVDGAIYVDPNHNMIGYGTPNMILPLTNPPAQVVLLPTSISLLSYDIHSYISKMGSGMYELILNWKLYSSASALPKDECQHVYFSVLGTSPFVTFHGSTTIPTQSLYVYNGATASTTSTAITATVSLVNNKTIMLNTSVALNYSSAYSNITRCPSIIINKLKTDVQTASVPATFIPCWGT